LQDKQITKPEILRRSNFWDAPLAIGKVLHKLIRHTRDKQRSHL